MNFIICEYMAENVWPGNNTLKDILCHQVKPPVPGISYISLSHWPKELHETPPKSHTIAKVTAYFLQQYGKTLLLKVTLVT